MKSKQIVLDALRNWNKQYSPTYRDLCEVTGYCKAYVYQTVLLLEEEGLISRTPNTIRTITLTEKAMTHPIYTDVDDMISADGEVIHFIQTAIS